MEPLMKALELYKELRWSRYEARNVSNKNPFKRYLIKKVYVYIYIHTYLLRYKYGTLYEDK